MARALSMLASPCHQGEATRSKHLAARLTGTLAAPCSRRAARPVSACLNEMDGGPLRRGRANDGACPRPRCGPCPQRRRHAWVVVWPCALSVHTCVWWSCCPPRHRARRRRRHGCVRWRWRWQWQRLHADAVSMLMAVAMPPAVPPTVPSGAPCTVARLRAARQPTASPPHAVPVPPPAADLALPPLCPAPSSRCHQVNATTRAKRLVARPRGMLAAPCSRRAVRPVSAPPGRADGGPCPRPRCGPCSQWCVVMLIAHTRMCVVAVALPVLSRPPCLQCGIVPAPAVRCLIVPRCLCPWHGHCAAARFCPRRRQGRQGRQPQRHEGARTSRQEWHALQQGPPAINDHQHW